MTSCQSFRIDIYNSRPLDIVPGFDGSRWSVGIATATHRLNREDESKEHVRIVFYGEYLNYFSLVTAVIPRDLIVELYHRHCIRAPASLPIGVEI